MRSGTYGRSVGLQILENPRHPVEADFPVRCFSGGNQDAFFWSSHHHVPVVAVVRDGDQLIAHVLPGPVDQAEEGLAAFSVLPIPHAEHEGHGGM